MNDKTNALAKHAYGEKIGFNFAEGSIQNHRLINKRHGEKCRMGSSCIAGISRIKIKCIKITFSYCCVCCQRSHWSVQTKYHTKFLSNRAIRIDIWPIHSRPERRLFEHSGMYEKTVIKNPEKNTTIGINNCW